MYKFSKRSLFNLQQCHTNIQILANAVIKKVDFTIIKGYRDSQEQNEAYKNGFSKLQYPNSKHNKTPSEAIDIIPYPFKGWEDIESFNKVLDVFEGEANRLGIKIRLGRDFSFKDYPHIEVIV